jgi:Domain of unknown function (DUF4442)
MKRLWRQTMKVRAWSFWNVPLLWIVRPSILQIDENRCEVVIPLNWITRRRDIHAMYFGTLAMGADVAGGLIAFNLIAQRKEGVSFIFKDFKADFLKRAEGDVHFVNEDGPVVQELLRRTLASGEREEAVVHVTATVPKKLGNEPVAKFELTLSLRRR